MKKHNGFLVVTLVFAVLFIGCAEKMLDSRYLGKKWELVYMKDVDINVSFEAEKPFIGFNEHSNLFGNNGCNLFQTTYTIENDILKTKKEFSTTRKFCDNISLQAKFLDILKSEPTIKIQGDMIMISNSKGEVLLKFKQQ